MRNQEDINGNDEERLKQDWCNKLKIGDAYVEKKDEFMEMLSDFHGDAGRSPEPNWYRKAFNRAILGVRESHWFCSVCDGSEIPRMCKKRDQENAAGRSYQISSGWISKTNGVSAESGSLRFDVNYRKLKTFTKRGDYPPPSMDNCIDSLGEAAFFSTLDAISGDWQVEIETEDQVKTRFTSHHRIYCFVLMPFGFWNSARTFQKTMYVALRTFKLQCALNSLHNIFV